MDLGLEKKVAVVAAASRGLGYAIAAELGREGAELVICARGAESLEKARAQLAADGAEVTAVAADLSTVEGIHALVRAVTQGPGHADILVTNAGGPPAGKFEQHDWNAWDGAVNLTLRSAVELTRAFLPGMIERKWGRILNITSIAAKQPVDNLILSNSIRAAVTGFARTLANEVASKGVTVNNLLPGYTRTERVESLAQSNAKAEGTSPDAVMTRIASEIPMRRLGEPKEFAALAAFLASDRASYITGQSIAVDGGWIKNLL